MTANALSLGVDVGGTNIKAGVVDDAGRVLAQLRVPTEAQHGADSVLRSMLDAMQALLAQAGLAPSDVQHIGIGVPGTADSSTGVVLYAPNLFWRNIAVGSLVQQVFRCPVHVAQDTRAATWAEFLVGAGQGKRALAGVTLGTGVGCGLVFDGRIFHGALNTAGEFGHQLVEPEGASCNCGRRGCLEAHAGGLAIMREARRTLVPPYSSAAEVTVDEVYALALNGDPAARAITDRVVRYVGIGLVNLLNLTSVEVVALSGGISNAPRSLLLDPLVAFVRANVYETIADKVQIDRSMLGDAAPMIGAALLYKAFAPDSVAARSTGVAA